MKQCETGPDLQARRSGEVRVAIPSVPAICPGIDSITCRVQPRVTDKEMSPGCVDAGAGINHRGYWQIVYCVMNKQRNPRSYVRK